MEKLFWLVAVELINKKINRFNRNPINFAKRPNEIERKQNSNSIKHNTRRLELLLVKENQTDAFEKQIKI